MKKNHTVLEGKRIIIVDDESDILAALSEILKKCIISTAGDFKTAKSLLSEKIYDAAILDIMGVRGYDLLTITKEKGIPTLILTAHALSPDDFVKSIKEGAHAYVPKEKMAEIENFLEDILEAQKKGKQKTSKWFSMLEHFFEERFGSDWKNETAPEFWEKYFYL